MPPQRSRKGVGGRPKSPEPMVPIASFKGSREFLEWFNRLSDFTRLGSTALIEHALVKYAQSIEFPEEAPKR